MELELDITKSLEENASIYFDKAKKAKKKMEGVRNILEIYEKKLVKALKNHEIESVEVIKEIRKKEWYEKFRWFFTSDGLLCIGGRDATTNEIIIKKYTDVNDLVFHTDMAGSPFFVLKAGKSASGDKADGGGKVDKEFKEFSENSIQEASDATVTFSRAWKLGLGSTSVFHVSPNQVSKEANTGEFLSKGSFMIRGKTSYIPNKINLAVGTFNGTIMAGPVESVKVNCKDFLVVVQGKDKPSVIAKKIKRKLGGEIDDIIRVLPSGNFSFS